MSARKGAILSQENTLPWNSARRRIGLYIYIPVDPLYVGEITWLERANVSRYNFERLKAVGRGSPANFHWSQLEMILVYERGALVELGCTTE